MRGFKGIRCVLLAGASLAAVLPVASSADAAAPRVPAGTSRAALPGYEVIRSQPVTVSNGQRVTLPCPAGKVVLSGNPTVGRGASLLSSIPSPDARAWIVSAADPSQPSVQVSATLVCAPPPPGYYLAASPVAQNVAGSTRQSVTCATPGTVALGVGGQAAGLATRVGLSALYVDQANGVYRANTALNQTTAANNTLQAFVVCANPPAGYELVTGPNSVVPSYGGLSLNCPSGKSGVSGGLSIPGTYSYIALIDTYPPGTSWGFTAFNASGGNYSATASLVCVS